MRMYRVTVEHFAGHGHTIEGAIAACLTDIAKADKTFAWANGFVDHASGALVDNMSQEEFIAWAGEVYDSWSIESKEVNY